MAGTSSMSDSSPVQACDRCKSQKLRCQRPSTLTIDTCERCTKARLECTTSPPGRPGRPKRLESQQIRSLVTQSKKRKAADDDHHEESYSTAFPTPLSTSMADDMDVAFELSSSGAAATLTNEELRSGLMSVRKEQTSPLLQSHTNDVFGNAVPDVDHVIASFEAESAFSFPEFSFFENLSNLNGFLPTATSSDISDKDQCLRELSNLNAALLLELNNIDNNRPYAANRDMSHNPTLYSNPTNSPNRAVYRPGKVLGYSQKLIRCMKFFVTDLAIRLAPPGIDTEEKARNSLDPTDGSEEATNTTEESRNSDTTPEKQHQDDHVLGNGILDFPSMLMVISCYVHLIRIYQDLFIKILSSLQESVEKISRLDETTEATEDGSQCATPHGSLTSKIPSIFPGLHLDGFDLTNHRTLQITILIQISLQQLGRLERGIHALIEVGKKSDKSASEGYSSLLEMMLRQGAVGNQKDKTSEKSEVVGVLMLKILARKIEKSMMENMCLQLEEAGAEVL